MVIDLGCLLPWRQIAEFFAALGRLVFYFGCLLYKSYMEVQTAQIVHYSTTKEREKW